MTSFAALDQSYGLASFSNYGSNSVDVGAPGVNIRSEVAGVTTTVIADNFSSAAPLPGTWLFDPSVGRDWPIGKHFDPKGSNVYTNAGVTIDRLMPDQFYLSDPSGFDITPPLGPGTYNYEEGIDDTAYVTIDLPGYDVKTFEFKFDFAVFTGDWIRMVYSDTGGVPSTLIDPGDPVDPNDGSQFTATYVGGLIPFGYELPASCGVNCSVGFNLQSDMDGIAGYGVDITNVLIKGLTKDNSSYAYYGGTSMATPHVAGVAALTKVKTQITLIWILLMR